jgi:hypothetical protein
MDVTFKHKNMFFVQQLPGYKAANNPEVETYIKKHKAKTRIVSNLSVLQGSGVSTIESKAAAAKHLETMLGVFTWAVSAWPLLKCYLAPIRSAVTARAHKHTFPDTLTTLDQDVLVALQCLLRVVERAFGKDGGTPKAQPITPAWREDAPPDCICRTDGSTKHGIGGVNITDRVFFAEPMSVEMKQAIARSDADSSLHIEAFALVGQIFVAAKPNSVLQIDVDSTNVRDAWRSGNSSNKEVCHLLLQARAYAISLNCFVRVRHVPRTINFCADSLSNQDFSLFAEYLRTELGLDFDTFTRVRLPPRR